MTEAEQRRREVCIPVGERIRHFRDEARMTKEGLAEAADISTQYVSDIEQGRKCMNFIIFGRIAKALHIDMETLLYGCRAESPAEAWAMEYLRELTPMDRQYAADMLIHAARAILGSGPEDQGVRR